MGNAEAAPSAAIVVIGAEVLSGKVEDQNGPFLLRELRQLGIDVVEMRVVADDVEAISAAVAALAARTTYVFTTGGVGPTHDDVTIAGVAKALGRGVVRDPDLERRIRDYCGERTRPAHLKMAEIPAGASIELGEGSFMVALSVENVMILPGVPDFMRRGFARVAGTLRGKPYFSGALLLNIAEAEIAAHLTRVQESHPEVMIGSYPRYDPNARARLRVSVDGHGLQHVRAAIAAVQAGLEKALVVAVDSP